VRYERGDEEELCWRGGEIAYMSGDEAALFLFLFLKHHAELGRDPTRRRTVTSRRILEISSSFRCHCYVFETI